MARLMRMRPGTYAGLDGRPYAPRYKEPQDMADSSFDIVSKVERQEVDNALNQASREISQRYDFKNVGASIAWSGERIEMRANSEEVAKIIRDEGPEGVKAQVQGDELRVTSKSRDDLQAVIALLKGKDLDFALQ